MAPSRFRVPHTLVLLFGMVVVAYVLTYLLPQGKFQREEHGGHELVVAGSYERVAEPTRLPPWQPFLAIPNGFDAAKGIIFFVFIIGGAFGVFRATGAADSTIAFLLRRLGNFPAVLIAGGLLVFAAGSSTIGMAEEYLPFVPILLALAIGLGFDAVTAVGILCIGYGVGYGTAVINPFTVIIAWEIAGVDQGTGLVFRLSLTLLFLLIGFHHIWRYANRVKNDPSRSLVADIAPPPSAAAQDSKVTTVHVVVLAAIAVTLGVLIWGLKTRGWYVVEMGALFLALTVVLGLVARLGFDKTAQEFCTGAAELTTTALLIGFARSIQLVLDEGQVVDTIVYGISQPLERLGPILASVGMLGVQSLCNFFIPSGSGQAYVTMPIMAPVADLTGLTRQVAVLAYQFGDGFTNIIVPTNAVLIGILSMARIPFERWLRFIGPFLLKILVAASLALMAAVLIGLD